ncbi:MAG: hypothetical protein OEN22_05460 [Gammaproteobacteria bacterium]|nr:hypothetical protein [Gammaproteobacteria bacterium]
MNRIFKFCIAVAIFATAPLAFACDYPQRAQVPDGDSATKDEMIEGQKSVKAYMAAMEDYLACIEAEEKDAVAELEEAEPEELEQRQEMMTKKYNAAVEEMEIVAAQFNEQVRAYKGRSE